MLRHRATAAAGWLVEFETGRRRSSGSIHDDLNSVQASFQTSMLCLTGVLRMKILPSLYSSITLRSVKVCRSVFASAGRFLQSDKRHRGGDSGRGRLDHAVAVQERSSRYGDRAVRGRRPMDRIALHLFVVSEEGPGKSFHPIHDVARRPSSHRAIARLLGVDPEQGRLDQA
jgi:hypothetical protein